MKTGQTKDRANNFVRHVLTLLLKRLTNEVACPATCGPSESERGFRDRIELLQAENQNLRQRLASLPEVAAKLRALESVTRQILLAVEEGESGKDGHGYVGNDAGDAFRIVGLRQAIGLNRLERRPSQHNLVMMWADERRKRECSEERLKDLEEFLRLGLTTTRTTSDESKSVPFGARTAGNLSAVD